jgi:hypothetical protein
MSNSLTLTEETYALTVVEGGDLQLTLSGEQGPSGPNTVSTSTTNIILDNLQEYKRQRRDIWFLLTGKLIVLLRIDIKYDSFNTKLS